MAAPFAPGSFSWGHNLGPSHGGTGPLLDWRKGECGATSLPRQARLRLASDVMESWPAAAGSHRCWLTRLASAS